MEILVVDPAEYSRIVTPARRDEVRRLMNNRMILPKASGQMRRAGPGSFLRLSGRRARVIDVLADVTQGYEGMIANPVPDAWPNAARFVIMRAADSVSRDRIRRVIRNFIGPNKHFAIRSEHEARFMRYGAGSVRVQSTIKFAFGEFPGRPLSDGRIEQTGRWRARHITTGSVPILGNVTCHRKLFRQLRGALAEVRRRGLSHTINRGEYAGCYNSRFVAAIPKTRISRHSWGAALDINARSNCLGCTPTMDRRLVRIFERWGFIWGGRFALPDGMHMEWYRFP
jgi:hypothetical protein